ncbi:MAG: glycosyltransferase family 4 protein [Chloroflexi bacterium]|nr:glycosyltransferase family 4 protein [Chloroflexota bacterium]
MKNANFGLRREPVGTAGRKLDLAIVHLTFEGIQTFGGGVATVTRGHLAALPQLKQELLRHGIAITPYFAEIAYLKSHERRDPTFQKHAEDAVRAMGGRVEYLVNYSEGYLPRAPWGVPDIGTMDNWKAASASGANVALNIARQHDTAVVYCHDSIYALAPLYITLQEGAFSANATAIYVIHATALTHEMPLPNPDRLMAESAAIHWAKVNPKCKLGYISKFMSRHVIEDYGGKAENMVPTSNGINPLDPYFRLRDRETIVGKLRQYDIPLDRPVMFSWGRAVAYKRYDMVLEAAARLEGRIHPVIMVTPEFPELVELDRKLGTGATLIFAFDPELVACMLQWENSEVAASLAYREPFGLTPIEIRMHARRSGPICVVSDTGGLVEQVKDTIDGFVTRQDDPDSVATVVGRILGMSERDKDAIRQAGLQVVLSNYTWSGQILSTLAAAVPEVAAVARSARDSLAQESLAGLR